MAGILKILAQLQVTDTQITQDSSSPSLHQYGTLNTSATCPVKI